MGRAKGVPSAGMHNLIQDVRGGFRQLRVDPVFGIASVSALALSIGSAVAIVSVLYGVLLHPSSEGKRFSK